MILDKIVLSTEKRVKAAKELTPLSEIKAAATSLNRSSDFPFERRLSQPGMNFICEVKRASPSKGLIAADFPYLNIAKEYETAGAAAISVLTEPEFFLGGNYHLRKISSAVGVPCLRKDFIIDEYQIYESKILGASAVLLICALLDTETLKRYIGMCDRLGMSALVEVHDEKEMCSAIEAKARIIGVNNRSLRDFTLDLENSIRLRTIAPADIIFVAESGIRTAADAALLREAGISAVLVGEALMWAGDRKKKLNELRGE